MEKDPYGRNPHEPGTKLDAGKAPVFQGVLDYFPRAIKQVAMVSAFGASKYAWKGWESVPDGVNRYSNAMGRHITDEAIEGPVTHDSGLLHKAHIAWNALAALELYIRQEEQGKNAHYQRDAGAGSAGTRLDAECVPKLSAKDTFAQLGRDVLPTEPIRGGGGAIGLSGEVQTQRGAAGGWLRKEGTG